jgi:uncharacterized damage-inducible protein DinB
MTVAELRRMFRYDHWANHEVILSLKRAGSPPQRPLELLAHVLAAQQLWLDRLRRRPQRLPVWPASSLEESEALAEEMAGAWSEYLNGLAPGGLEQRIDYTNTKGQRWVNSIGDVLHHVIVHSAYHRGQIAAAVRAAGHEPAYTDFIEAARRGYIDEQEKRPDEEV